jgi:hypothetical protein
MRYLTLTLGGGASYDVYESTDARNGGQFGPVGMISLSYPLSTTSDLGLAFEYGGDRFFLGAYFNFALNQGSKEKAQKKADKKPASSKAKK